MPHKEDLLPKRHAFKNWMGQRPLTLFRDYQGAIKVELIKHDNPVEMLKGTYDFVKATWSETGRESDRASEEEMRFALKQMLSGKALGLGLETVNFIFRISGISRIDTHQIVRQRIGVTFSQQCSGDRMAHHQNCLVEPSIARLPEIHEKFIHSTLNAKMTYAEMVDSGDVSIQAARSILPHNLETFIFMHVNLATLLFFYQKRIDNGSQTWQINKVAEGMQREVCRVFPELEESFNKARRKFTFQRDASIDRENTFSTGLYLPDPDDFEYHQRDFLYNKTKSEMHWVNEHSLKHPMPREYYWGYRAINLEDYMLIKEEYEKLDQLIDQKRNLSNDQIRDFGYQCTESLERKITFRGEGVSHVDGIGGL